MSKILSWKLFEAFKSSLISNTLKFIKKDKEKFLNDLKVICDKFDFPMSELNDDYFKYLPKKWALEYKKKSSDVDLNTIKFWFDSEGKFLCITTTDAKENEDGILSLDDTFSKELNDYQTLEKVDVEFVKNQKSGVLIKFKPLVKGHFAIGVTFKSNYDDRMYLVQDYFDGSSPGDYDLFIKNWGKYSWVIVSQEDLGEAYLVKNATHGSEKSISWLEYKPSLVKDAHFAIVMDLENLKSELSLSGIKKRREESKKDSLHFMTEEEIKNMKKL